MDIEYWKEGIEIIKTRIEVLKRDGIKCADSMYSPEHARSWLEGQLQALNYALEMVEYHDRS